MDLEALLKDAANDFIKKLQLDYLNRFGIEEAIFCENAGKVRVEDQVEFVAKELNIK